MEHIVCPAVTRAPYCDPDNDAAAVVLAEFSEVKP